MDSILHPSALGKHYSCAGFVLWLIAYQVQERIMNRAVEPSVEEQVAEAVFIQVCTILFAIGFLHLLFVYFASTAVVRSCFDRRTGNHL